MVWRNGGSFLTLFRLVCDLVLVEGVLLILSNTFSGGDPAPCPRCLLGWVVAPKVNWPSTVFSRRFAHVRTTKWLWWRKNWLGRLSPNSSWTSSWPSFASLIAGSRYVIDLISQWDKKSFIISLYHLLAIVCCPRRWPMMNNGCRRRIYWDYHTVRLLHVEIVIGNTWEPKC